jgi:hypothetical protein
LKDNQVEIRSIKHKLDAHNTMIAFRLIIIVSNPAENKMALKINVCSMVNYCFLALNDDAVTAAPNRAANKSIPETSNTRA